MNNIAEIIKGLKEDVYKAYEVDQKPQGKKGMYLTLDLAMQIVEDIDPEKITPEILDELPAEQFRTARDAVDVILYLKKVMQ